MENDTNITKEEYLKFLSEQMKTIDYFQFIKDETIINKAKTFCSAPVVLYDHLVRGVETFKFETLTEMRNFVNDKEFILYLMGISIKIGEVNKDTFIIDYYDQAKVLYTLRAVIL